MERTDRHGLIMVYTGDGKGKTTAALGLAMRAIGHGFKVFMVQFMKGDDTGELSTVGKFLSSEMKIVQSGSPAFIYPGSLSDEDLALAAKGLAMARDAAMSGEYDLVIMDEANVALDFGLLPRAEVIKLLKEKPAWVDIVLTGRGAPREIVELADLVSEVREIKHHFRQGIDAREGIEF